MGLFKDKKITIINVIIEEKAYDYPRDLPIPKIGETVSVGDSHFGKVTRVLYQIEDKDFRMITIYTENGE